MSVELINEVRTTGSDPRSSVAVNSPDSARNVDGVDTPWNPYEETRRPSETSMLLEELQRLCGTGGDLVLVELDARTPQELAYQVWSIVITTFRNVPPRTSPLGYLRRVHQTAMAETVRLRRANILADRRDGDVR